MRAGRRASYRRVWALSCMVVRQCMAVRWCLCGVCGGHGATVAFRLLSLPCVTRLRAVALAEGRAGWAAAGHEEVPADRTQSPALSGRPGRAVMHKTHRPPPLLRGAILFNQDLLNTPPPPPRARAAPPRTARRPLSGWSGRCMSCAGRTTRWPRYGSTSVRVPYRRTVRGIGGPQVAGWGRMQLCPSVWGKGHRGMVLGVQEGGD